MNAVLLLDTAMYMQYLAGLGGAQGSERLLAHRAALEFEKACAVLPMEGTSGRGDTADTALHTLLSDRGRLSVASLTAGLAAASSITSPRLIHDAIKSLGEALQKELAGANVAAVTLQAGCSVGGAQLVYTAAQLVAIGLPAEACKAVWLPNHICCHSVHTWCSTP